MQVALRSAQGGDFAAIAALLAGADLPTDDLAPESVGWFVVAQAGTDDALDAAGDAVARPPGGILGAGAVQPLGEHGLLRSVVVAPALRSMGVGARIVDALEAKASAAGMVALYLLTADAAAFFEALGYRRIDRADAPQGVRASAQFASICPASAVCMTRTFAPRPSETGAPPREHLPRGEDFLLWPPGIQPWGYRIVDRLFATRTIACARRPSPIERGPEIEPRYRADGVDFGVADFMDRNVVAGLLVLKDRRIVLERYGLGLRADDRWSTMSTVKSMTAMLVGAALLDGALRSVDDPVTDYLPRLRGSAYDGVSLRNLMTMSSGVRWIEDYADRASDVNRYSRSLAEKVPAGVLEMMAALPRAHPPGSVWNYNSGDTYLLGALLSAATGRPLAHYMSERIWKPCGMEFDAYYTLESDDGQEIGGSRAGVALRDFGRFARLVLDDGVVDGRRILRKGWVDEAARQAFALPEATLAMPHVRAARLRGYGYSWWLDADGAMIANGFAGQRMYIHRGERLAVVTLAAFAQPPYLSPHEPDHPAEVAAFTQSLRRALG